MNEIISFKEIEESPIHYINKLVDTPHPSYLLFNYGPYLATKHPNEFIKRLYNIENVYTKIIVAFALFDHFVNNQNSKTCDVKNNIRLVIKTLSNQDDQSYIIKTYGETLINQIRDYQYKNNVLESAILNYSPIIQYSQSIIKPDMEDITYDKVNEFIRSVIIENPMSIIHNSSLFLSYEDDITKYIYNLQKSYGEELLARIYFLYVHLSYTENKQSFHEKVKEILKLNIIYNKIHNGERIDIERSIKTFESLLTL